MNNKQPFLYVCDAVLKHIKDVQPVDFETVVKHFDFSLDHDYDALIRCALWHLAADGIIKIDHDNQITIVT